MGPFARHQPVRQSWRGRLFYRGISALRGATRSFGRLCSSNEAGGPPGKMRFACGYFFQTYPAFEKIEMQTVTEMRGLSHPGRQKNRAARGNGKSGSWFLWKGKPGTCIENYQSGFRGGRAPPKFFSRKTFAKSLIRKEETSELQSPLNLVCRLLL